MKYEHPTCIKVGSKCNQLQIIYVKMNTMCVNTKQKYHDSLQLRLSFYDNIIGVAAFVGQQCSPILLPLLQQGLSDSEEFVIAKSINTMASLTGTNFDLAPSA